MLLVEVSGGGSVLRIAVMTGMLKVVVVDVILVVFLMDIVVVEVLY